MYQIKKLFIKYVGGWLYLLIHSLRPASSDVAFAELVGDIHLMDDEYVEDQHAEERNVTIQGSVQPRPDLLCKSTCLWAQQVHTPPSFK